MSFISRWVKEKFSLLNDRPVVSLVIEAVLSIVYLAALINILRLLVEREIIFVLRDKGLLPMEPYYWSKPVVFFIFLALIIFCIIQRGVEKFPRFLIHFSVPAFFFNLSAAFLFLAFTHFLTARLALFEANTFAFSLMWYALGALVTASVFFIFFDFKKLVSLFPIFKKEWLIAGGFALVFVATFPFVQELWKPLSYSSGTIVAALLSLTHPGSWFDKNFTLHLREFASNIGAPCSGVEGMSLFIVLFTAMLLVDWKRSYKARAFLLYPVGILMMYVANVFRIYTIQLLGYEVAKKFGPDIAHKFVMDQYHSHVGWIFYTVIILVFFKLTYSFFIKDQKAENVFVT